MEVMTTIANMVQMVGVPCVALGAVMWYVNAVDIRQREERKSWYDSHASESDKWTEALNNNTKVVTELVTLLKKGGENND